VRAVRGVPVIRWLLTFMWGLLLDELRAQLRPFLEPLEIVEREMRWQAGAGA